MSEVTAMIRKSLAIGLAALLVITATGCGKNAVEPGSVPTGASTNSGAKSGSNEPSGSSTTSSGNNDSGSTTSSSGPGAPSAPQAGQMAKVGPLARGETAQVGPISVTLSEVEVVTQAVGLPEGYAYVLVDLTIRNDGSASYTINTADHTKMTSPDGKNRNINVQAMGQRSPRLQGTLDKGETQAGWLGYLVKYEAGNFTLLYTHPDYGEATWEFHIAE